MKNKQKAWRTAGKGRKAKESFVRVLPFQSMPLQCLLLRAGVYGEHRPASDEHSKALDAALGLVPA